MKKLYISLMIIGLALMGQSAIEWWKGKQAIRIALEEVQLELKEIRENNSELSTDTKKGDVIGILHIPKLTQSIPIIEGTEFEELEKGVGHYESTLFPGEGDQILLSGHRNTVFMKLGELEKGDMFIYETAKQRFYYELRETQIVNEKDTTVIGEKGEEVLTLSTCYPFQYVGYAPDRYVVYAYPIKTENIK